MSHRNPARRKRRVEARKVGGLIAYMEGDHAKMLVMDKVLERLDRRPLA